LVRFSASQANIVSCSRMNLSAAPTALPPYTAVLDLSFNEIAGCARMDSRLRPRHQPALPDLSSNGLRQLDEFIFEPLARLEVLLLYHNHISQIDAPPSPGLKQPAEALPEPKTRSPGSRWSWSRTRTGSGEAQPVDVSSNRVKSSPSRSSRSCPPGWKNGIYFHGNPLLCDCALYSLLAHWYIRRAELPPSTQGRLHLRVAGTEKRTVDASTAWGTRSTRPTTTLVGCLASVVLVLIYLYLTPCCPASAARGRGKGKNPHEDSIHSSMLSATPTHEDLASKAELNRHVAFIDPKDLQSQNGKFNPSGEGGAREGTSEEVGGRVHHDSSNSGFIMNYECTLYTLYM
uniref:Uncharacterized protein n=1 Tax=Denticeps clupeoides TaxID=299321 RepID=A0AAY4B9L3_9TELE